MEASTMVIKVLYGHILRRFSAKVVDLSMAGLTAKIFSLFSFAPDTQIMLTFTDEDGDSLALVDDDDLRDVVKQSLNPLRITVKLNAEKNATPIGIVGGSDPLKVTLLAPTNPGSFSKFPVSSFTNKCPFPGISVENVSAAALRSASQAVSFNRSDGSGTAFHPHIRGNGRRVDPITGPIIKAKRDCFAVTGNDDDYFRKDYPAFKGFHGHHISGRCATLQQMYSDPEVQQGESKLDSCFIQDDKPYNILVTPSTPFTKIWRIRNNGTVAWPQKTRLVWIGGSKLNNLLSVEVEIPATGLAVGQELDVSVDFISPHLSYPYISYWRLTTPSGQKFGQQLWVLIHVSQPGQLQLNGHFSSSLRPLPSSDSYPVKGRPSMDEVETKLGFRQVDLEQVEDDLCEFAAMFAP